MNICGYMTACIGDSYGDFQNEINKKMCKSENSNDLDIQECQPMDIASVITYCSVESALKTLFI